MSNVPAAVLWDMDGTLVDTEPYWFAAENQLVESFGNTWSEEHAHAVVGFDLLDTAAYIIEHGGVDLAPRDVVEHVDEIMKLNFKIKNASITLFKKENDTFTLDTFNRSLIPRYLETSI